MRIANSFKNMIGSISSNFVTILLGFVAQLIFIRVLGTEFLGINGLFTNIISMLGIVELGIGAAIIYSLYEPLAKKDEKTIKSLMNFYKKAYISVALVVLSIGISMIPFLGYFVQVTVKVNLIAVFLLFLFDVVFSYLLSYKRSILYADQKNYIINIVHILSLIILNAIQITVLIITGNYYLYLIMRIIMRIIENITLQVIANKKYPYLKDKNIEKLDKTIEKGIIVRVKALFLHKIGGFFVLGTDNIIISKFFGIIEVGLYSNYFLIIKSVQMVFSGIITSTTASIGNLIVTAKSEEIYDVYKKIRFINFWISTFAATSLLLIMEPFIKVWIGAEFLLPFGVLVVLAVNYYFTTMRNTFSAFKDAAGIYYEDRYVPLIEAFTKVVFSLIFLRYFGLAGVFLGTIVSGLLLHLYSYPKYVYIRLFNKSYLEYLKEFMSYFVIFALVLVISFSMTYVIILDNNFLKLILNIVVAGLMPNLILFMIFRRSEEIKFLKVMLSKLLKRGSK